MNSTLLLINNSNPFIKKGFDEEIVAIPFKRNDSIKSKPTETYTLFNDSIRFRNEPVKYSHSVIIQQPRRINVGKPIEKTENYSNWFFILLLIGLILYARLRYFSFRKINLFLNAVFTSRAYNQMEREGNILEDRISIPLFILYLLTFSLLVYHSLKYYFLFEPSYNTLNQTITLFLGIFILILILFLVKTIINIFLSFVFKTFTSSRNYRLNTFLIEINIGFIILPLVFTLSFSFSDVILYLTWCIVIFFTALRIIKGMIIWYPTSNIFKIFLYFCTVEIAPIIIVVKYFINNINLIK